MKNLSTITIATEAKGLLEVITPAGATWNKSDAKTLLHYAADILTDSKEAGWAKVLLDLVVDVLSATNGTIEDSVEDCLASIREFIEEELATAKAAVKPAKHRQGLAA